MRHTIGTAPYSREQLPSIVIADGGARSGKGTSMAHLYERLVQAGQCVVLIDQGIKFRAMGLVATIGRQDLDSPTVLNGFIRSPEARASTLAVLAEVSTMDKAAKKAYLYTTELSKTAGKIGKVPAAHTVATQLLRTQVTEAAEAETNVILIDGRAMEKYARQYTKEGLARFVMGWHFKCDPAIAARRSLGLFEKFENLKAKQKHELLAETLNISDRNRSDTLRTVDPLREPAHAYALDLLAYDLPGSDVPYRRACDILHGGGMTIVDTSYTSSVEEMTGPITELSMFGLMLRGSVSHQDVGIRVA